ncbi:heme o synthase [Brevibacillus fluminis]|uniref:heme o synthase n=1 Tax=Brevibacillus fluminis TaxID=511487 RepID=UPI003F895164
MDQPAVYEERMQSEPSLASEHVDTPNQKATWRDYWQLCKPGIITSNLMTAFIGLWLAAAGTLQLALTINTLLGTALVIASGAALNNYWDRDIDTKMKRTKNRAVATGKITPRTALLFGLSLLVIGLLILTVLVNPLAAVWSLIGHVFYVLIYTPMKRVSSLNTVVGAISGATPPVIGWVAVTGRVDMGAWLLFLIIFIWQMPHFLSLAMMKVEEYGNAGLPMLPNVKGFEETKRQMFLWTGALVPASLLLFFHGNVGYIYLITALVLGVVYLVELFKGFHTKDDMAWARKLFGYSLIYLTAMCAAMFISAIQF